MDRLVSFLQDDLKDMEDILNLYYATGNEEERKDFAVLLDAVYYWQQHSNKLQEVQEWVT